MLLTSKQKTQKTHMKQGILKLINIFFIHAVIFLCILQTFFSSKSVVNPIAFFLGVALAFLSYSSILLLGRAICEKQFRVTNSILGIVIKILLLVMLYVVSAGQAQGFLLNFLAGFLVLASSLFNVALINMGGIKAPQPS